MALVQEIKQAVSQLSQEDLSQFRQWFEAFDAHIWDQQFEHDAKSGKLDAVAERAVRKLIDSGTLPAHKIGREWFIDPADLERAAVKNRRPGRPKR